MRTESATRDGAVVRQIESIGSVELTVFFSAYDNSWFWSVEEEPFKLDPRRVSGGGEPDFDAALKEGRRAARNTCAEAAIDVPDSWVPVL